ncbi:MFS transporter [Nonomuraea sediminis]|uniref:MFS transporter n=1 Tax=Nonomuraea sediminis TaxID=2835864 RepID=UPI00202A7B80|nr:MFS transporter [Nonomuraea sediminis]
MAEVAAPVRLGRLLPVLGVANAVMFALYAGVGVLLGLNVEQLDPAGKVSSLGLISGIGAVFATVFNPVGGALSDRTRSRFGRRVPWMIGGSVAALGAMALMAGARSLFALAVGWCLGQATMNLFQAALTAIVPDRVPEDRRGTASAVLGIMLSLGSVIGTLLAARFAANIPLGYLVFGALVVGAAVLASVFTRDSGSVEERRERPRFLSAMRHRDFMWVFIGRTLMVLGYFMVLSFLLYILKDYIGLPPGLKPADAVARITLISTACSIVATLIGGPLSDKLNRRKAFVTVAGVVAALALLIPLLAPSWGLVMVFAVIHGSAFGLYFAVDIALATLVLPNPEDAARDLGVLNVAAAGPQIAAPFVASAVIQIGGGYAPLFGVAVVVCLAGALAVLPIRSVR